MVTIITLTPEVLESTVRDFFKDYFYEMIFTQSEVAAMPVLNSEVPPYSIHMTAYRSTYKFCYEFYMYKWDGYFKEGSEFHRLEHMKGECVRSEKQILLEHEK